MSPDPKFSIAQGVRLAISKPTTSSRLLAKTLATMMNEEPWITHSLKLKFCILLLDSAIDKNAHRDTISTELLHKIKEKPLLFGIQAFKKAPDEALEILTALVIEELRYQQKVPDYEFVYFCDEMLNNFFPELRRYEEAMSA